MSMTVRFFVEDSRSVDGVDAYLARGMDNLVVGKQYSDVYYFVVFVAEKRDVAGFCFS